MPELMSGHDATNQPVGNVREKTERDLFEPAQTLVFGLAGQLGSGASFVRDKLMQDLRSYGYEPHAVDISRVFLEEAFNTLARSKPSLADEFTSRTREIEKRFAAKRPMSQEAKRVLDLRVGRYSTGSSRT